MGEWKSAQQLWIFQTLQALEENKNQQSQTSLKAVTQSPKPKEITAPFNKKCISMVKLSRI